MARPMLVSMLIILAMTSPASARQSGPVDKSAPEMIDSEKSAAESTPAIGERDEQQRRRNVASILVILLVGVGLVGVLMIVAAWMWGAKLRRLAREPAAGPTRQDELWYLKTPPPPDDGRRPHPPLHAGDLQSARPSNGGDPATDEETKS